MARASTLLPRLAAALTLALATAGPGFAQAASNLSDEICALLGDLHAHPERAHRGLDALGERAVPLLLDLLVRPASICPEALPPGSADAVTESLLRRSSGQLAPHLEALLSDASPALRRRALQLLGLVGGPEALELLTELALELSPTELQARAVQSELETAIASLLQRHPQLYASFATRVDELSDPLQATAVRALGVAADGRALAVLERLTRRSQPLDHAVLEALAQLDPAAPECLEGAAGMLGWHVSSKDPKARRLAARALARHGGPEQLPELLALLADPDPITAQVAEASLGSITRMSFGSTAPAWEAWIAREASWHASRCSQLLTAAEQAEPAAAFAALRELSGHPLFRRELCLRLTAVLERRELEVATAACQALQRLGGPTARAPLARASVDPRTEVAATAELALVSLRAD